MSRLLTSGILQQARNGGGAAFDPDYQAVLDFATAQGYTLPSAPQQNLQNTLVVALKSAGVWNKLHIFRIYATDGNNDFALINWKNPGTFDGVRVNSPTFITNQGYEGDGVSATINTDDYLLENNQQLNNWGSGAWIFRETTAGDGIMGSSGNNFFFKASLHSSQFNSSKIQQGNSLYNITPSVSTLGTGFRSFNRTGDTEGFMMRDDVATQVTLLQSTELDTGLLRELYRFNVFSNGIHSGVWAGEPIIAEHSDFKAAIQNYINSL